MNDPWRLVIAGLAVLVVVGGAGLCWAAILAHINYRPGGDPEPSDPREPLVRELTEEWLDGDRLIPIHAHLGLTAAQYHDWRQTGILPAGYVPPHPEARP